MLTNDYSYDNLRKEQDKMLKEYLVEYYTNEGKRVGTRVSAYSSLDAKMYAEKLPDFRSIAMYPREV